MAVDMRNLCNVLPWTLQNLYKNAASVKREIHPHLQRELAVMEVSMIVAFVPQSGEKETGLKVQHVKQRLQIHFGDKLCFFDLKGKTGIVYSEETPCKEKSFFDVVTSNVKPDLQKL